MRGPWRFEPMRMFTWANSMPESGSLTAPQPGADNGCMSLPATDLSVLGESLKPGDGLAIENAATLEFQSQDGSQFLLFDLN